MLLGQHHVDPAALARGDRLNHALEGLAFVAKDVLMVIDDFAPCGSSYDIQRFHREADRITSCPDLIASPLNLAQCLSGVLTEKLMFVL